MSAQVRPQARFATALMAAGVVSAVAVVGMPEHPTISVDVANASAVTDALYGLGDGVGFLSSMVGIHVDAAVSLPFEATLAVLAVAQHPELAPNVLSYLVQRFVNPAVGPPIAAYPWETEQAFAVLATLFPYPLGPSATEPGLVNEARLAFADAFNSVLGQLPDPLPGYDAVQDVMNDTVLGGTVVAGQLAARAPLYMAWNTVNYLGYLPANVEATLESAVATPDQVPGLASNLVYGLLSPDAKVGLFGQLLDNAVDPLTWLPKPIGQSTNPKVVLANEIRTAIDEATNGVLSVLPKPVKPSAAQNPPANLPTGTSTAFGEDAAPKSTKPVEKPTFNTRAKSDDKNADANVGPSKAKHRKTESIKDRVTRALSGGRHTKPAKAESAKPSGAAA
ncbi:MULTISPECIES: hypothetical protein [unclassified Mycobacterium]|uniref:hypothetical protein n=1 Tax=unclassified Mycobacterium TaxID=2642494 RepID=UPI0029C701B3|nr:MULTISPECIES: hypothetical protein [unclassified Mycobacterium]